MQERAQAGGDPAHDEATDAKQSKEGRGYAREDVFMRA